MSSAKIEVYFRCDFYDRETKTSCQKEARGWQELELNGKLGELRPPPGWNLGAYFDPTCQTDLMEIRCAAHVTK